MLLYDGDCAFCTRCARLAERRVATSAMIIPWQSADLEELGIDAGEVSQAVVWLSNGPDSTRDRFRHGGPGIAGGVGHMAGPRAIAALLGSSRSIPQRAAGWLLDLPGVRHLAWIVYRWVARNRHRMPGGTPQCAIDTEREGPVERDGDYQDCSAESL